MDVAGSLTPWRAAVTRAETIDWRLGDPHDRRLPCSFRRVVDRDEREAFAPDMYRVIDDVAVQSPLQSRAADALMVRTIARRDPGLAFAWACSAAARAAAGHHHTLAARGAVALLVPISSAIAARRQADGYRLSGECSLTPNLRHATSVVIEADLVDTGRRAIFAFDRRTVSPPLFHCVDRVRTVGLRTADIGACRLSNCLVRHEACIGTVDRERVDVTEVGAAYLMVAAASLGIADTVLRAALEFARSRAAYGRTVFDIPHVRALLAAAAVDLVVGECMVDAACEATDVQVQPWIVWSWMNRTIDGVLRSARIVLGARGYCREGFWDGIVEKLIRDHMVLRAYPATPDDIDRQVAEKDRMSRARAIAALEAETAALTDGAACAEELSERLHASPRGTSEAVALSCAVQAATLFVRGWRRAATGETDADAVWLAVGVDRLARQWRPLSSRLVRPPIDVVIARLLDRYESGRMFSIRPVNLAPQAGGLRRSEALHSFQVHV